MKLYTEEDLLKAIQLGRNYGGWVTTEPEILKRLTPMELPSDEEIDKLAEQEFPFPTDVVSKKNELIITKGLKPFNYAKIEKYRRIWTQGYRKAKQIYKK